MKIFSCGDVVPGCGEVFRGEDDDTVLRLAGAHAAQAHGVTEPPAELVDLVRRSIRAA